jgi:uncharacterized damage-inducible protein DinB
MTELAMMADQLKRAYEGPAWSGPSLLELLGSVTAEQAARRPIPGGHTIWELVAHIVVWEGVATRRLQGEVYREYSGVEDWPPVEKTSEAEWKALLAKLKQSNSTLRETILGFGQDRLFDIVPNADYSFYVLIHGAVQHDFYHAGQIAILKRA